MRLQLKHLTACQVHRHFNQFFLCAYRTDTNQYVCYALVSHYSRLIHWQLLTQTRAVADAEQCIAKLAGKREPEVYNVGLLYVSGSPNEFAWPMALRISEREYAQIFASALERDDMDDMRTSIQDRIDEWTPRAAAATESETTP